MGEEFKVVAVVKFNDGEEQQALNVLFEMEEGNLLQGIPHRVMKIDQSFRTTIV